MPQSIDLHPAARELSRVVENIKEDQLQDPTPCEGTSVAALLDHVVGLTMAFRDCGRKQETETNDRAPEANAEHLDPDWRALVPQQAHELASAWADPLAWQGMSTAGGVTMPSEVMGIVALNEVVIHGWDLARATEQQFECDPQTLAVIDQFNRDAAKPENAALRDNIYGPIVDVADSAPPFDKVLGLAGRSSNWTTP